MAALTRAGIHEAFPIQSATIADALAGRDVLGKARTGSGKTLAFGLPCIARLADAEHPQRGRPHAVVLVPTRELAMQVNDALEPYAHALGVSLRLVAGGLSMTKQIQALERGVHLLVATPGRLADLVRRGHADLRDVQITVLDEADHMAQMGFMDEITEILAKTPRDGQRLLFSATLDGDVEDLITRWMHSPVTHDVTGGDDAPMEMTHVALNVPPHLKYQIATRIANRQGRTIAFVRTKLAVDRIAEQMRAAGVLAVALHGDKPQAERTAAITGFRAGTIPVLVATDVAARGIHVDHVDLVLQIDPPVDPKDYTHRAGRTARAGAAGLIVTLVLPHQRKATDNMFEGAGIEPLFRKVKGDDAESLSLVDRLTGGSEPTGIPVEAPAVKIDERDWRANRDAARRSDRMAHNGAGRRALTTPASRPSRRWEDDGAKAQQNAKADALARREAEIAERERTLAERESKLASRETELTQRPAEQQRSQTGRPERASNAKGEGWAKSKPRSNGHGAKPAGKSYGSKPYGDKSGGNSWGDKPHSSGSSSAPRADRSSQGARGNTSDGSSWGDKPREKTYGSKPAGKSYGDKPYGAKSGGTPYGSKPAGKSYADDSAGAPRPERSGQDRKLYGNKPAGKSYGDKPSGARSGGPASGGKPYGDKPASKPYGDKPAGKSYGDKPAGKSYGDKPAGGRSGGATGGKAYGGKPASKSYGGNASGGGPKGGGKPPKGGSDSPKSRKPRNG